MASSNKLEDQLNEIFVKKAPFQIPENGRKTIAEWLPWISLVLGILTLWSALVLWQAAHAVSSLVNYANEISAVYGGSKVVADRITIFFWVSLVVVVTQGLLMLAAFPGTKARQKSGWNLLFYSALLGIISGIVSVFISYRGVGTLLWSIVSAMIGLYLLFQIRSQYTGEKATKKVEDKK